MRPNVIWYLSVVTMLLAVPGVSEADETDNFTCGTRLAHDSRAAAESWVTGKIQEAIARANRHLASCPAGCLFRDLENDLGASSPEPLTLIPHARFEQWLREQPDVDRCHLQFKDTIYGARPYNLPWLFPIYGRIIFVADSIRLAGHVVGLDKVSHFIREGLSHWRQVHRHQRDLQSILKDDLGPPGWHLGWDEHGLKGMSLTGVVSYADLAAGYSGYVFWSDVLSIGQPHSFVSYDANGRFIQSREFSFADYVNDSWDEAINLSTFDSALDREVTLALARKGMARSMFACRALASLPDAALYVNPSCLAD